MYLALDANATPIDDRRYSAEEHEEDGGRERGTGIRGTHRDDPKRKCEGEERARRDAVTIARDEGEQAERHDDRDDTGYEHDVSFAPAVRAPALCALSRVRTQLPQRRTSSSRTCGMDRLRWPLC